jgi:hypothetical protein
MRMTCWPGSPNWAETTPAFEERVWREARRLCPRGVPATLLLIRPLPPALSPPGRSSATLASEISLTSLARMVRTRLRRSDAVVVEERRGIAVVLVGAHQDGARLVADRLRAGCAALCPTPGVPARLVTLGIGYGEVTPLRPLDRWHADGALRAARRPRLSLRVACPIAESATEASASMPASAAPDEEWADTLEAPRPRLIHFGGRRKEERLPALVARETRRLAVGAPIAPPSPLAVAGETLSARVLTLAAPVACHTEGAAGVADQRDRLRLRALSLGVPFLHLPPALPPECVGALSLELARELRAVPVGRTATALTIALDTRWSSRTLFRLRAATGLEIFPVLTQPDELDRALASLTERPPFV